jgi:hypothetical protein
MACPTAEQLAAVSLGIAEEGALVEHVRQCDSCTRELASLRDLVNRLGAIHGKLNAGHDRSRAELLRNLPAADRFQSPSRWRRFAVGSLGLSAAAVLLLLSFIAFSADQLSAMERIAQAVRHVTSFSCRLTNTTEFPSSGEIPARTHHDERFIYWRAPTGPDQFGDMHATTMMTSVHHLPAGDTPAKRVVDLVEIHPSGKRGILVDYLAKRFFQVPALHARDIANSPPLLWLQAVREQAGEVVQDLGTREIDGRRAHGISMTFAARPEFKDFGPVEVWLDPETDLPIEFRFHGARPEETGYADAWSVSDIQWNHALDPKLFDTTAPAGFLDVTLPSDERSIAEIVAALKLYAELTGGRYPHFGNVDDRQFITKFDGEACYREMFELAGFSGLEQDGWDSDPKYQRIQKSRAGLDTLERILQSYKWLVGYNGDSVKSQDKDKVLLWWNVARENSKDDQYRLFYGDLRTEVVPRETWVQFVPPDIAEIQ